MISGARTTISWCKDLKVGKTNLSTQRCESLMLDTKDPDPKTEALKDHSYKDKALKDLVP